MISKFPLCQITETTSKPTRDSEYEASESLFQFTEMAVQIAIVYEMAKQSQKCAERAE